MNKTIESIKLVALVVAIIGTTFKIMHWPGANVLLIAGLGLLVMGHIITGLRNEGKTQKEMMLHYAFNFGLAVGIAGLLFKIMHWPGSEQMLFSGALSAAIAWVFRMFGSDNQEPVQ